jgi:hypothetical protein
MEGMNLQERGPDMYNSTTLPYPPSPGGGGDSTQNKAQTLIGRPAGISLRNGTGVSILEEELGFFSYSSVFTYHNPFVP